MRTVRPSFFIIGAAKAGTTSLAQQLSEQSGIFIPPKKELVFFSRCRPEPTNCARYEAAFQTDKDASISGEASPQYSFGSTFPFCAGRIAEYCPQAKIIYIVRDPVIRMQSHILQIRNWGGLGNESVPGAIEKYPQVVEASMYASRLNDYLGYFAKEQIMVIPFEQMVAEGGKWLPRVGDFLGVDIRSVGRLDAVNVSANHFEDRGIMRVLRRFGLGEVGLLLPHSVKSRFIHFFKKRQTEIPHIPEADAAVLEKLFREEARPLFDEWGLDEQAWTFRPQTARMQRIDAAKYEGKIKLQ
jgi:hypothetical protein